MKCILSVIEGPAVEKTILVQPGETLTIGRNHRASVAIPDDPLLSSLHFSVRCDQDACVIQDLGSTNKTFVHGTEIARQELQTGDVVQAGNSVFRVTVEASAEPDAKSGSASAAAMTTVVGQTPDLPKPEEPVKGFVAPTAAAILSRFGEPSDPFGPLDETATPESLAGRLVAQGRFADAIRFLAYGLPKRPSVWWACRCLRDGIGDSMKPAEEAMLQAAESWVKHPIEDNRRAAMAAAEKIGHDNATSWAGIAAFWSGGSMAPPNAPVVPPGDDLTAKAVSGAVQLAAVIREPEKGPEKQKRFVETALAIARGERSWESAPGPH